jgi:hypothetical protein
LFSRLSSPDSGWQAALIFKLPKSKRKFLQADRFGVFTRPTHKTDVPLALTNDCFWERNDSKIELTAKLRGAPVEGRIWYPMSWEEPTKAAG